MHFWPPEQVWHGGTHISTGSAVVPAAGDGVEGLLAAHAHGHQIVPHPLRGSAAQLLCLGWETIVWVVPAPLPSPPLGWFSLGH